MQNKSKTIVKEMAKIIIQENNSGFQTYAFESQCRTKTVGNHKLAEFFLFNFSSDHYTREISSFIRQFEI